MDALNIKQAVLGGYDWGARSADIVSALWPERVKALVSVSGYLIGNQAAGKNPLPPQAELQWWYQFYFATERGRDGYQKNTHDFAKLIWQLASPKWAFDDATFDRSAKALENPDHVDITVFNYRWRLGLVQGESQYEALEQKLATAPSIGVPTITLEGDANGAPHPAPEDYAKRFTGKYEFRLISGISKLEERERAAIGQFKEAMAIGTLFAEKLVFLAICRHQWEAEHVFVKGARRLQILRYIGCVMQSFCKNLRAHAVCPRPLK